MKIRIKIGELVEQISQAAITVDPKSVDQPNSKIYLRAAKKDDVGVLYYYSTNQMSKTFIRSDVEVLETGEGLVDAGRLLGGLQGRDNDQIAEIDIQPEKKIIVKIGRNKFQLPQSLAADKLAKEVETLPFKAAPIAKIKASLLLEFIRRSTFCIPSASNGQQKFAMDVLHLKVSDKSYIAQATDGNIISTNTGPLSDESIVDFPSILLRQEVLNPLQKLLGKHKDEEIELINGGESAGGMGPIGELYFKMQGVLFGCSLRVGKYPNVQLLIDQNQPEFRVTVNRNELKGSLLRASNFVIEDKRYVQFVLDNDKSLRVRAGSIGEDIRDEIDSEVTAGELTNMQITMALDYIANVVATLPGDTITLGFSPAKNKPIVILGETRTEDDKQIIGSIYAISPVKPLPSATNE